MSEVIRRAAVHEIVRLTNSEATSPTFQGPFESGMLIVPASASSTSVTFWVQNTSSGVWVQAYTAANAAISITVAASRAYPLPAEIKAAQRWRIKTSADDDDKDWIVSYVQ